MFFPYNIYYLSFLWAIFHVIYIYNNNNKKERKNHIIAAVSWSSSNMNKNISQDKNKGMPSSKDFLCCGIWEHGSQMWIEIIKVFIAELKTRKSQVNPTASKTMLRKEKLLFIFNLRIWTKSFLQPNSSNSTMATLSTNILILLLRWWYTAILFPQDFIIKNSTLVFYGEDELIKINVLYEEYVINIFQKPTAESTKNDA